MELELSNLTDEEYLAARGRLARDTNLLEAKAWLITSNLLFPDNFKILYDAYTFERDRINVEESAKHFNRLFKNFTKEEKLWDEVEKIVEHVEYDEDNEDLYNQIFLKLPQETQRSLLIHVANRSTDPLDRPRFSLLAFEKFPDLINSNGSELLHFMIVHCKEAFSSSKDFAKLSSKNGILFMLVMEVCPKLLEETSMKIDVSSLHDIVSITMMFLTSIVRHIHLTGTVFENDLEDSDVTLANIWKTVIFNMEEIGSRMGWIVTVDLSEVFTKPDMIMARIIAFQQDNIRHSARQFDHLSQLYYTVSILFLRGLCDYYLEKPGLPVGRFQSLLLEGFVTFDDESVPLIQAKRRRTIEDERRSPLVTDSYQKDPRACLIPGFMSAMSYFDLARSDSTLDIKLKDLKSSLGESYILFQVDALFYQGNFRESLQALRQMHTPEKKSDLIRYCLKMASLHFCLGDHEGVADAISQAVHCLKPVSGKESFPDSVDINQARKGMGLQQSTVRSRHVHFLSLTKQSVLSYCTRLLMAILKDRTMQSALDSDVAIGHVIVLLQYSFPEEKDLLFSLLHKIKTKECFSYNIFCNYVVNVEILEEFALLTTDNSNLVLDITPSLTTQRRMGTRGANRGEKNDTQKALKKQVRRCYEDVDKLIIDFVTKHRDAIMQCFQ